MKLADIDTQEAKPKEVKLLGPAPSLCFPRPSTQGRHLSVMTLQEEDSLNVSTFIDRIRTSRRHVDAHLGGVED